MVAAEKDRHPAFAGDRVRGVVERPRPAGDLGEMPAASGQSRIDRHRLDLVQRAPVADPVPQIAEHAGEPGGAQRLRPHQRAARAGSELEPDAEERNVPPVQNGLRPRREQGVEHIISITRAWFAPEYAGNVVAKS